MQNERFVVLTGHLNNYPLSDLVGILRHQRKSGRLLIEYAKGPATFFFQNGELIDARMNELTGLQAICEQFTVVDAPSRLTSRGPAAAPRNRIAIGAAGLASAASGRPVACTSAHVGPTCTA